MYYIRQDSKTLIMFGLNACFCGINLPIGIK